MPDPTDKSETSTLPDTELNPLLNPLLAENLGRWAEVYFTSPPENRAQAVSALLSELRKGSPAASISVQVTQDEKRHQRPETENVPDSPSTAAESPLICSVCGHNNSAAQKFCGMCGAPLHPSPEGYPSQAIDDETISASRSGESEPSLANDLEHAVSSVTTDRGDDAQESPWTVPGRSLPSFSFASEPEPVPYRYRIYVGGLLAVVLVLLLYMAWRGTRTSGSASSQPAAAREIPPAPPAEPTDSPRPTTTESAPRTANPPDSPVPIEERARENSRQNQTATGRAASPHATIAANSSAPTGEQSGAQDFATAQKYLSGAPGAARDSREASLWLWKAVSKGNLAATVALSDLYLRGDGVPKSCDQGRLLLDAAARKGGKGAAERLRNLQAFGCQ